MKGRKAALGSELEEKIAQAFLKMKYRVFLRRNRCDILAVRGKLAYLVECKNYILSKKEQKSAVRQLKPQLHASPRNPPPRTHMG